MSKNKDSIFQQLRSKYVLSIRNENEFLERARASLNIYEILSILFLIALLFAGILFSVIRYTPIRYLIISDTDEQKQKYFSLIQRTDSIENVMSANEYYIANVQRLINGETIDSVELRRIDSQVVQNIKISAPSKEELLLREKVKEREAFELLNNRSKEQVHFIEPIVNGILSSTFNNQTNGVTLLAEKSSPVLAIDSGHIIYTTWTDDDGHIILIKHKNDFLSVYKNNRNVLKSTGDQVKQGETIAIVAEGLGESKSGYELHFELWKNGIPQNPSEYINLIQPE